MSTIWSECLNLQNSECFYIANGSLPLTNNTNQLCGYLCVQFGLDGEIFFGISIFVPLGR
jgi:hypothetical protein